MAEILFAEGFQWADAAATVNRYALAVQAGGVSGVDTSDPLAAGGRRIQLANDSTTGINNGKCVYFPMPDLPTEWCVHFWYVQTDGSNFVAGDRVALCPTNSAGTIAGVNLILRTTSGTNRRFAVRIGTTTVYEFAADTAGAEAHYAISVVEHASTGIIRIHMNGALLTTLTGQNTARASVWDRLRVAGAALDTAGGGRWAHIIITDGEILDYRATVGYQPPDEDTGPNDWVRNTGGSDYAAIDETPNDVDSTYLLSAAAGIGNQTRHAFRNFTLGSRRIVGIQPGFALVRFEASGFDRLAVTAELLPGPFELVDEILVGFETAYTPRGGAWVSENPDTSVEFTEADIQAIEVQYEHLAAAL